MSAHKKRRVSLDQPDAYKDFSSAAAAVSSLYVQAVQAGRKGRAASLERVASWVLKEWGSSPVVPTQALLSFLKAELDAVAPPASPLQPPLAMLPPQPGMSEEVGSDSDDDMMRGSPSGRRQQQQPQLMQQHVQPPQLFPMPMQPPR